MNAHASNINKTNVNMNNKSNIDIERVTKAIASAEVHDAYNNNVNKTNIDNRNNSHNESKHTIVTSIIISSSSSRATDNFENGTNDNRKPQVSSPSSSSSSYLPSYLLMQQRYIPRRNRNRKQPHPPEFLGSLPRKSSYIRRRSHIRKRSSPMASVAGRHAEGHGVQTRKKKKH